LLSLLPAGQKYKNSVKIVAIGVKTANITGNGRHTEWFCTAPGCCTAALVRTQSFRLNISREGSLMKITDWRRKLMAALVAGGFYVPCAASAADLGANLVINGDFETVNLAVTGQYNGPLVLGWTGPNLFAYSHDGSMSSKGVVADYAEGTDPPNAGHWYFTSNNTNVETPTDVRAPGVYFQDINVATGATGSAIAAGLARYDLRAFMSSYLNDNDNANVQVDFRNAGGGSLGTATLSDPDFGPNNVWSLHSIAGAVPIGTASVRMSLYGTPRNGGADGYIDNVVFSIARVPEPGTGVLAGLTFAATGAGRLRRRRDE
jgi:hypothetical protein